MFAKFAVMKWTFYTIIYTYLIVFGSILTVHSVPADRRPIEVTQPDGSKLTILLKGDEFLHFAQTMDGYDLKQNKEGFYTYADRDTDGRLLSGTIIAREIKHRSASDHTFLSSVPKGVPFSNTVLNAAFSKRMRVAQRQHPALRSGMAGSELEGNNATIPPGLLSNYPRTGSPKSLVILVNFADSVFKPANSVSNFSSMLNQQGYNQNRHVGSVRDYYKFNSNGLFSPEFVVVGPVTIANPMAYYGENDKDGNDLRPAKMVFEACKKADNLVDFSQFDYDLDGFVDNVYIYYAGKGEADGGIENTIWPHSWSLVSSGDVLTLDGKKLDTYACSGELNGYTGQMTGMGTFTHEYSHILGLTDMYDVDYEKYNGEAFDINAWSLMAYGAYNNNSSTPPCLTLPERYFLGWATPIELNSTQAVTVHDFGSTNQGYVIKTTDDGEYFLIENRQKDKNSWDAYLPHHGMLIYHIDMRTNDSLTVNYWGNNYRVSINDMWQMNIVNALANHQCCDLEEADNMQIIYNGSNYLDYIASIDADPFPGTFGVNRFSDVTNPSMRTWNGTFVEKPLSAITESNGVIRFNFMDFSGFTKTPVTLAAETVAPYSFTASWNSILNATGYYIDVFTLDESVNPAVRTYIAGYQNKHVADTVLKINVKNDLTTYYYQIKATFNDKLFTAVSNIVSLRTTDGTPISLPATLLDEYSFKANWQRAGYASGYYLDVFSIDSNTGDTTWLNGYKNLYLTKNYFELNDLDDQTTYYYVIRGTNGSVISRSSAVMTALTSKASEIRIYAKDRNIVLKGMDKGGKVLVHTLDGLLVASANSSQIPVENSGIYLVTAYYNGKVKHLKLLVP